VASNLAAYQTELESFVARLEQGLEGLGEQLGQGLGAVNIQLHHIDCKLQQLASALCMGASASHATVTSLRQVKGARYSAAQLIQATEVTVRDRLTTTTCAWQK
jgi:hypothetical protein